MDKYSVIYADPPWEIKTGRPLKGYNKDTKTFDPSSNISRKTSYENMTIDDICKLNIADITSKNAHLYIWATNKHLPFVFDVIKKWGFTYSTTIVWAKNKFGGGLGGSFKIATEFLIFARKGNLKSTYVNESTWFNVKRTYENGYPKHSKKPDFFYDMIERTSPGLKLELFARQKREGWSAWGNEIENDIEINS